MPAELVEPGSSAIAEGSVAVVKLGGRSFETPAGRERLARAIASLVRRGVHAVVVHGGGAQITHALSKAGVEARFVNGLRVTDEATLAVAESVLTSLGKGLAHSLTREGAPAVGLSGRDAAVLQGAVKDPALGRVGSVVAVDDSVLRHLAFNGLTPVVAPIAVAADGGALNVNADEAAGAIAKALRARHLVLCTDVEGVRGAAGNVLPTLTPAEAETLIASGHATGGMIPKLRGALDAIAGGVRHVHVVSGERPETLADLAAGKPVGTSVGE